MSAKALLRTPLRTLQCSHRPWLVSRGTLRSRGDEGEGRYSGRGREWRKGKGIGIRTPYKDPFRPLPVKGRGRKGFYLTIILLKIYFIRRAPDLIVEIVA